MTELKRAQQHLVEISKKVKELLDSDTADDYDWLALKPDVDYAKKQLWDAARAYLQRKGVWDKQMERAWDRAEQRPTLHMRLTETCLHLNDAPWTGARGVTINRTVLTNRAK
jgi:hypothetical protein